jgi:hypothetical protein
MEDRFCPSCGTEIEGDARFCPSCGRTLSLEDDDQPQQPQDGAVLPEAPAWPPPDDQPPDDQPRDDQATRVEALVEPDPEPAPSPAEERSSAESAAPPPPPPSPVAPAQSTSAAGGVDLPITWPTTLSGWLIGGGSLLGALALIPRLGNVVSLLLFLALVGVAATVFLADRLPDVPRQRLAILAVSMVGLGIGLARAGFSVQGADTVFLVAMLGAAGGALLIELDRDRPIPPPNQRA